MSWSPIKAPLDSFSGRLTAPSPLALLSDASVGGARPKAVRTLLLEDTFVNSSAVRSTRLCQEKGASRIEAA